MFGRAEEKGLARVTSWAIRDRVLALRDEIAGPWRRDDPAPEEQVGRWLGFGLAAGALVVGVGLALITMLGDD